MTGAPNVVVIVGENARRGNVACNGGLTSTRRINALATESVRFESYRVDAQRGSTRAWVQRPVVERLCQLQWSAVRLPRVRPGQVFTGYA
jgi:hypothetical protein